MKYFARLRAKQRKKNEMPAKNDNITKDPAAAGRKGKKKGIKKKKTILKENLGIKTIEDLIPQVLANWEYLSKLKSKSDKKFVNKEISPYLFTKKQQTDLNIKGEIKLIVNGIEKL